MTVPYSAPECDAELLKLYDARDEMLNLVSRITGKSGDLNDLFNGAAMQFHELVASDIRGHATANEDAWHKSLSACWFAHGVIKAWIDDVRWYRSEISDLGQRWNAERNEGYGLGPNPSLQSIDAAREGAEQRYSDAAAAKWAELQRRAEEKEEMLTKGPDDIASVQRLVDSGAVGWGLWNSRQDGIGMPPLVGMGPDQINNPAYYGRELARYLDPSIDAAHDGELSELTEEELNTLITVLNTYPERAAAYQDADIELPEYEVQFLETFYEELFANTLAGTDDPRSPTQQVSRLVESIAESKGYSESEDIHFEMGQQDRDALMSGLGAGLLTLSDERVGGGYSHLPQPVRDVAEGQYAETYAGGTYADEWAQEAHGLAQLLDAAPRVEGRSMRGGTEFSANLTTSVGLALNDGQKPVTNEIESLQSLVQLSTRNEDANYQILTGEHENPTYGDDPWHGQDLDYKDALAGLFTADWEDDGLAASGLTDWISRDSCGPDAAVDGSCDHSSAQHERAGEAMYGLIEVITSEDIEERLRDTGIETRGVDNSAFTRVNPRIGQSLTDGYVAFLDDMTVRSDNGEGYGELHAEQVNASPFYESGDKALRLSQDMKQDFLQFLVADEEQAIRVSAVTQGQEDRLMGAVLDGEVAADAAAQSAGELRGVLDGAFVQEYNAQLGDIHEARAKTRTALEAGRIGLSTIVSSFGGKLGAGSAMFVGTVINDSVVDPLVDKLSDDPKDSDNFSIDRDEMGEATLVDREDVSNHVTLQAGRAVLAREDIEASHLADFNEGLVNDEGDLPGDIWEWDGGGSKNLLASELRNIITGYAGQGSGPPERFRFIPDTNWENIPSGRNLKDILDSYEASYENVYHDIVNPNEPLDDEEDPG